MSQKTILIYTDVHDAHADKMVDELCRRGHEPIRLNTNDIPRETSLSVCFGFNNDERLIHLFRGGRTIDFTSVKSVWWRRPGGFNIAEDLSEQELAFARKEIGHTITGIFTSLDCYWISNPKLLNSSASKIEQLQRAREFGFSIPRTVITNNPYIVKEFYAECGKQIVFKVMSDPFLAATDVSRQHPEGLYFETDLTDPNLGLVAGTTSITEAELALLDQILVVPGLFQEKVDKKVELRITVVGNRVFAAEIHSQVSDKTRLDWREHSDDIPFMPARLPPSFESACLDFVKSYGLSYSAMDFIITPDGEYVFLENNPSGQFLFVENRLPELNITKALGDCLIEGGDV